MTNSFLFGVSLTASFLAGVMALFAPCCITFLFPSYLGTIFKENKKVMWYTLVFAAGLSVILVPIALGFRVFVFLLDAYHAQVYYAGALVLVAMGIATVRPFFHLPALFHTSADWKKNINTGTVFGLGLMSGLTSSCCAPVLFAAVTLTALTPSLLQAAIVSLAYVLGIVFPLFILSVGYERLTATVALRLKNKLYTSAKYAAAAVFILSGIAVFIANAKGLIVMNQMEGYSQSIRLAVYTVAKHVKNPFVDTGIFVAIVITFIVLLRKSVSSGQSKPITVKKISFPTIRPITILVILLSVNIVISGALLIRVFAPNVRLPYPFGKKSPEQMKTELTEAVNPSKGYALPIRYGTLGPAMIASGAIDPEKFASAYAQNGQPLTDVQKTILTKGSDAPIVITRDNAYFLLNFFWAVGLSQQSSILTNGPMMENNGKDVGNFASTGGWTLGRDSATTYYSKNSLVHLTPAQEALVKEVADHVYRPCCDNPTSFPDCNHGMAMLGLFEVMAASGATKQQLYDAAKYVNAFWFPSNYYDLANYFYHKDGTGFADVPAALVVGKAYSSASGWVQTKKWLVANGFEDAPQQSGGSCST